MTRKTKTHLIVYAGLIFLYLALLVFLSKTLKPYKVIITSPNQSYELSANKANTIPVTIRSLSRTNISKRDLNFVSYHLKDTSGNVINKDGPRTDLRFVLFSFFKQSLELEVEPLLPGDYILEVEMVKEGDFWYTEKQTCLPLIIQLKVVE